MMKLLLLLVTVGLSLAVQLQRNDERFSKLGEEAAKYVAKPDEPYEVSSIIEQNSNLDGTVYAVRLEVLREPSELCIVWIKESSDNHYSLKNIDECKPLAEEPIITAKKRPLLGGSQTISDIDDDSVQRLLSFAVEQRNSDLAQEERPKELIKIIEAKQRIVTGVMYTFTLLLGNDGVGDEECTIEIWEKVWQNFREVTHKSCQRAKRDGETELDPSELFVEKIVNNAVKSLNDVYFVYNVQKRIRDVTRATVKGTINGPIYRLTLDVNSLTCGHPLAYDGTCKQYIDSSREECNLLVLDQSRAFSNQPLKLLQSGCTDHENYYLPLTKQKRSVFGEGHATNITSKDVVEFAVSAIEEDMKTDYKLKVLEVINNKVQTVAGRLYKLKVQLGYTVCHRNSIEDRQACSQDVAMAPLTCDLKVWEKQWKNYKRMLNYTCSDSNSWDSNLSDEDKEIALKFKYWAQKYERKYASNEEWLARFNNFKSNLEIIKVLQREELGTGIYGPTNFADMSKTEMFEFLGLRKPKNANQLKSFPNAKIPKVNMPPSWDWRKHNAVTPIKNQGRCGSCWAFSTIDNIEGQYAVHRGKLYRLSTGELVECDTVDHGCQGGFMWTAYMALMRLGGIELAKDYPYREGFSDWKCKYNPDKVVVSLKGALNISHNEEDMAKWLYKNGPISIGINAYAMLFYFGGISRPPHWLCDPEQTNHGVLLVGYDVHKTWITKKELPYWIIKNSWGIGWGDLGYYKVYRGDGTCGLNTYVTSAIV